MLPHFTADTQETVLKDEEIEKVEDIEGDTVNDSKKEQNANRIDPSIMLCNEYQEHTIVDD